MIKRDLRNRDMRSARMRARRAGKPASTVKPSREVREEKEEVPENKMEEESFDDDRSRMKKQISEETKSSMRMTPELSALIIERYNELLKDMTMNDDSLDNIKLTDEEKNLINKKVELWLEYFISTATFRDDDVNLFDYLDSFNKTQKFL